VPIIIEEPIVGGPLGPGLNITVSTDIIGPLQPGSWWDIQQWDPEERQQFGGCVIPIGDHTGWGVFGWDYINSRPLLWPGETSVPHGADSLMRVNLRDPEGTIIETDRITVKNDQVSGQTYFQYILQQQAQGGFTETDRETLEVVQQSVQVAFPALEVGVPGIVQTLGQLVTGLPEFLVTAGEHVFLSGSGTLTRPAPEIPVAAFGGGIEWFTVPPNYGKTLGNTIEYVERLAQFSVIKKDGRGNEYVHAVHDCHFDGIYIMWGIPLPQYILYTIAPGVVVDWKWLLAA